MLKYLVRGAAITALLVVSSYGATAETLRVWGPEQITEPLVAELWNGIRADFTAANPGVTVEFMPPTGTISNGAVQAAIQSNVGPDVILTNSGVGRVTIVKNAKQVMPLTKYYDERDWKHRIYPWLYAELQGQFGGDIYEVPDGLDALGIWYHKDMFAARGWSIPKSWTDFLALMKTMKQAGVQPIAVGPRTPASAGHLFGNLLQSASGTDAVRKALKREITFDDPAITTGAIRLRELVDAGYIPKEMAGLDLEGASRLWFAKRAAMFVAGPWFTANARKAGYDLTNAGYVAMPSDLQGESKPTGGVGWSWLVPVNSKHPDLAVRWIDFILSDAVMRKRAQNAGSTMIYPRALDGIDPPTPVLKDIFAAAAGGVGPNPSVYLPGPVVDVYFQVLQGRISAQISGREGMTQIQSKLAETR